MMTNEAPNRIGLKEDDATARLPYRHPQPKDAFPEIVIPHAIPEDERLWVPQAENVWFRPLCLSASRGYWMNMLRVRKSGVLSRHRHPQPVHGYVIKARGGISSTIGLLPRVPMFMKRRVKRTRLWWIPMWRK